jgi:hypothetical protein
MAIARELLKKYPESFWEKLHLPFKLKSLNFFLSSKGKIHIDLETKKQSLSLWKPEEIKLRKRKSGKNKKIKEKNKNIIDFIDDA